MKTVRFSCPNQLLYLGIAGRGSRELRDRMYAAFTTSGLEWVPRNIAWEGRTHSGFDLAVAAALIVVNGGYDVACLADYTVVGHVRLNGEVIGGVIGTAAGASPVESLTELAEIIRADIDLAEVAS